MTTRPHVLMVTGVYHPETSGASLQCRQLIASLSTQCDFAVLTTSADPNLPKHDHVDGVAVSRVYVDPSKPLSKVTAAAAMSSAFARIARGIDVVHLHGFSQKSILLMSLTRAAGKRAVMKLTSLGHDDALTMKARGGAVFGSYRRVDHAIAVSPVLEQTWREAGLDANRVTMIPNAVDPRRFRPAASGERAALRQRFGWSPDQPVVLFVGFFSHEKRPDVLYRSWLRVFHAGLESTLVLVGATRSRYFEIDPQMAHAIRSDAERQGLSSHVKFIEHAAPIDEIYRAADVFVLPTTREGLPNVLLEAMASELPPIISRLAGTTDWIVDDGVTGRLVSPNDDAQLDAALGALLASADLRARMGRAARQHVATHFSPEATAAATLAVYERVLRKSGDLADL